MNPLRTVAVVGAGAAGLGAASALRAAGLEVTVIEARDRPGGRAVTDHSLGVPVDLGAAWLHFAHDNPFTAMASGYGFTVDEREPDWGPRGRIGGLVPDDAAIEAWGRAMHRFYDAISAAAAADRDVALTEVLPQDDQRAHFDAIMTWAVGAESGEISTVDLDRYAEGGPNFAVPEGLGSVIAREADAQASQVRFRYGTRVVGIDTRRSQAVVRTDVGEQRFDAVIVTVPTAVLASGAIRFVPPLPPAHRQAIEDLPLGVVNKVFFQIDPAALPPEPMFTIGRADTSRTAHYQLWAARQPVVMAFFGGDLSRELEASGNLATFARDELTAMFGSGFGRALGAELVTGWQADHFAGGSYSVARPGRADARAALMEPVTPRLRFAGEAGSRAHYGTLIGAWESGVAAAQALIAGAR